MVVGIRARGSEGRDGRGGEIHLEWADVVNRLVRRSIVGETDALGKCRPGVIFGRREQFHGAVPITPPTLDFSVALGVVTTGGDASGAGRSEHGREEFREELGGGVAMDNVRCTSPESNFVEKTGDKCGGGTVGEGDHKHRFGEAIHDSQGLGLASDGKALSLEIHGIARAGLVGDVTGEKTVG